MEEMDRMVVLWKRKVNCVDKSGIVCTPVDGWKFRVSLKQGDRLSGEKKKKKKSTDYTWEAQASRCL